MKKIMALVLCLTTFFTLLSVSASAATRNVADNGKGVLSLTKNGSFSKSETKETSDVSYGNDWELYAYFDSNASVIRFGFNNWATDEDYVYGYQKNYSHQAIVKNSTHSAETSKQAVKGKWTSKVDVTHGKSPVWSLKY